MVGALQYLTMTRPDIAYVVDMVSQFMHAPRTNHFHAVKSFFRYLQGTLTFSLFLHSNNSPTVIIAYSDADWVVCPDTRGSTSGYVIFLGKNLISLRSKKQPSVSKSAN